MPERAREAVSAPLAWQAIKGDPRICDVAYSDNVFGL
jgi:hypothetical protein